MRIYWGREIPGWFIFGCIALICLVKFFFPEDFKPSGKFSMESVSGHEYISPLHDSLPHHRYRQIEDSLKRLEADNDFFHQGSTGGELSSGSIGIASYRNEKKQETFFTVTGYSIEDFASVKNELSGSVLHYPVWDRADNNRREGHLETKPITIKYKEGKERWEGKVFAPINSTLHAALQFLMYAFAAIFVVFGFYAIFYVPLRFLLRLSRGQAFNDENIGSLYLTAWTLISFALFATAINIIGHLIIKSQIPQQIIFSYHTAFMKTSNVLLAGLAVLLLAKAFLQGLVLREEQDLTI